MALRFFKRYLLSLRQKLAYVVFGIFLIWPMMHIVIVNSFNMSSWRLFGWGMYATPTPDAQSRLRIVIPTKHNGILADMAKLHESITKLSSEPEQENLCANIFYEASDRLVAISPAGLCQNQEAIKNFDYFLHFGSTNHLRVFVNEALQHTNYTSSEAIIFVSHQRFNLAQKRAYIESDIYSVVNNKMRYRGKFMSNGDANDGMDS